MPCSLSANGDRAIGRYAVDDMLKDFHDGAFNAYLVPNHIYVGDGYAALEGRIVGTHMGEFAGVATPGREVDVPLAVVYTVEDRGITKDRAWFMVSTFLEQVT